jgi:type II secretory pathway pseudopilin PulG
MDETNTAQPPAPPPQLKTSGKAVASLVCGILGLLCLLPLLGQLAAALLGWLALRDIRRADGALQGRGLAITGLILAGAGILSLFALGVLSALLVPALEHSRRAAYRTTEMNNLKQIGLALYLYADDHGQTLPPDLAVLAEQGYLPPGQAWVSPACGTPAPTSAAQIRDGSACDYIFLLPGMQLNKIADPTLTVMVHSRAGCYRTPWLGACFVDGHAELAEVATLADAVSQQGWVLPTAADSP